MLCFHKWGDSSNSLLEEYSCIKVVNFEARYLQKGGEYSSTQKKQVSLFYFTFFQTLPHIILFLLLPPHTLNLLTHSLFIPIPTCSLSPLFIHCSNSLSPTSIYFPKPTCFPCILFSPTYSHTTIKNNFLKLKPSCFGNSYCMIFFSFF